MIFDEHGNLRGLKGGSKGGGGGGGGSGGGYHGGYHGGSGCYNCYGSQQGQPMSAGAIIALLMFFTTLGVLLCCCFSAAQRRERNNEEASFDSLVENEKASFDTSGVGIGKNTPQSGVYSNRYLDRGVEYVGEATLTFVDKGYQYELTGGQQDNDGRTTIDEGYCAHSGKAWWKETNVAGDIGMQTLSTGTFDFENHTFQGIWASSTGVSGRYTKFALSAPQAQEEALPPPVKPEPVVNGEADIVVQAEPVVPVIPTVAAGTSIFDQVNSAFKK
jgi:hypothetical protein